MSCQRGGCRADTDKNMGAEARRAVLDRALESDRSAAEDCDQHTDQNIEKSDITQTIEKREQWETSCSCY